MILLFEAAIYQLFFSQQAGNNALELTEQTAAVISSQLSLAGAGRYAEILSRSERLFPGEISLFSASGTLIGGSSMERPKETGSVIANRSPVSIREAGVVSVLQPVGGAGRPEAVLVLSLPVASTGPDLEIILVHALLTAALVGAGGVWLLQRAVLVPLGELQKTAVRVADGELGHTSAVAEPLELGELAATFNHLSLALLSYREKVAAQVERLQKAQDALVQTEKLASVGRLAAGLAHEIGNPLTAVRGYLDLLSLEAGEVGELAKRAKTEAERMHHILRDLLDFARAGSRTLAPVSVGLLLQEAARTVRHQPAFRDVKVDIELVSSELQVQGDAARLHQLLLNLLLNAAEAGARRVLLVAEQQGQSVWISCQDDGPGISKENLENIFEPFFTTKAIGKGTGLGLAVAHQVAEQHQGILSVESKLGEGATFRLQLPALAAAEHDRE
jgi:signal transduction histidine kinase